MARPRDPRQAAGPSPTGSGFGERSTSSTKATPGTPPGGGNAPRQQVIPERVANRMARRIAIGTGIPTLMGMGVFVGSYLLVSRQVLDVPPAVTLALSGGCFLLGLLGLSYGVLSASWEEGPGSVLGLEQLGVNLGRVRSSIQAMRQGAGPASDRSQG
ncbi:MAG: PAM68 family protein [Cyanobacteriota bacterium]|nr:PAM68 family protein [Cyanobacteriota bacterium]